MDFRNHLFNLNEVVNQQTMEDLGRMWFKHHDRDPYKRFQNTAERQSIQMDTELQPLLIKQLEKKRALKRVMKNAPEGDYNPNYRYKPGEIKPKGYYEKALDHFDTDNKIYGLSYPERASRYIAHKKGWEGKPGVDTSRQDTSFHSQMSLGAIKNWPEHDNISDGVNTMHQRAGERSMAAMNRLTNYMDKNGINQENPTMKDKQNYQNWLQRTNGRFVKR